MSQPGLGLAPKQLPGCQPSHASRCWLHRTVIASSAPGRTSLPLCHLLSLQYFDHTLLNRCFLFFHPLPFFFSHCRKTFVPLLFTELDSPAQLTLKYSLFNGWFSVLTYMLGNSINAMLMNPSILKCWKEPRIHQSWQLLLVSQLQDSHNHKNVW